MIRYTYVNQLVLNVYSRLPRIEFPLRISDVIDRIPNCRHMSYQEFASVSGCSVDSVIALCESKSGCTHYDIKNDRYLILYNDISNDNPGRVRWTCSHEIGHIMCQHFAFATYNKLCENSLSSGLTPEYEREADCFAATLLAPFPIMKYMGISSRAETQSIFGLSREASDYTFKRFVDWKSSHYKKAWENDFLKIYNEKK